MECKGYKRGAHDVTRLKALGWCEQCYMRHYRDEHAAQLAQYQAEYRADPAYKELNRLYVVKFRRVRQSS